MKYIIYTDGSLRANHAGGWAALVIDEGSNRVMLSGNSWNTTNNRMELKAPIEALKYISKKETPNDVIIYSDSQYLVNHFRKGWIDNMPPDRPNYDLLCELKQLATINKVAFMWVRGHKGIPQNCLVDRRAKRVAKRLLKDGTLIDFELSIAPNVVFSAPPKHIVVSPYVPKQPKQKPKITKTTKKVSRRRIRGVRPDPDVPVLLVIRNSNKSNARPALVYDLEGTRYLDWFNIQSTMRKSHCKIIKEHATQDDYIQFKKQFDKEKNNNHSN